jgi:signal peptidase I
LSVALFVLGLATLVAIGLLAMFALPGALGRKPYRVPSGSMVPTLRIGSHFIANQHAYDGGALPQLGDIIVFHPPAGSADDTCATPDRQPDAPCSWPDGGPARVTFVKRVVALPGDRLSLVQGHVVRNGIELAEPYASFRACARDRSTGCTFAREITIPAGHVFVMGDNRGASDDSRFWGPVARSSILGRVDRCGFLQLSCHARRN